MGNPGPWTESRWLTVGTSSRRLVIGILTELADLVHFIKEEIDASLFYLGFSRIRDGRTQFLTRATLISRVSGAVLQELFVDPRVALTYNTMWKLMAEETTSSVNGWVLGAIASAVSGLALLGYSLRKQAQPVATSVPV